MQDRLLEELYNKFIYIINGDYKTRNEINGYYQIGILRDGVTL
jgi:altronate dehydratase